MSGTGVFEALDQHFEDIDQVKDIARHGCDGGVNGFTYHYELREFFFDHEEEIEWIMDDNGITYADLNVDHEYIQDYITKAVWYVVQYWAEQEVYRLENALNKEYALANAY